MSATLKLQVGGMSCGHCQRAVEQAVSAVEGVSSVAVDLDAGTVEVTFAGEAKEDAVRAAIAEEGYTVS